LENNCDLSGFFTRRSCLVVRLCCLLSILLTQCSERNTPGQDDGVVVICDDLGDSLSLKQFLASVISLAPSITETIYFIGADSALKAVTRFCDYPPRVENKQVVGDLLSPDFETIVHLEPDLVLMTVEGNTREAYDILKRLGINVFVTNPRDTKGIRKSIRDLGRIFGREQIADALADSLQELEQRYTLVARVRSGIRILIIISTQPLMVVGTGTVPGSIISLTGAENACRLPEATYPVLTREEVLKQNPQFILLSDDLGIGRSDLLEMFPEWEHIRAIQSQRCFKVEADVFLRPGPRSFRALQILDSLLRKVDPEKL